MADMLTTIKADQLHARKYSDSTAAALLTTLIGEIETALRKPGAGDVDVVTAATVKKFIKNNVEFAKVAKGEAFGKLCIEKQLLERYLPDTLSEEQLTDIVKTLAAQQPNTDKSFKGLAMKHLKENYANQYDGKVAASVIDLIIAGN